MKRHDQFTWRGATLRWNHESWPKFDNRHEKTRDFFAEVSPVGTAWQAMLHVGELKHKGGVTEGGPTDALDACRAGMFEKLEDALGKVKP